MSASSWALVVGCDRYWREQACLRGAVRDALAMRAWLVDPACGDVPADQVVLLLAPTDQSPEPPEGVVVGEATNGSIQKAHREIVERSGGGGDRLFVYFAGHGLSGIVQGIPEPAIVPTDFDLDLTDRALSIRSSYEYFKSTNFVEQFFFYDACRDVLFDEFYEIGAIARPRTARLAARPPDQFVCYSTPALAKSKEPVIDGEEQGAFTHALVRGLRGAGTAKVWDPDSQRYLVTWDSAFAFAEGALEARRLEVGAAADGPVIQVPRQDGQHGSSNPVLAVVPATDIEHVTLAVSFEPVPASEVATLTVERDELPQDDVRPPPLHSPTELTLPPRSYAVSAQADGYTPRRRKWRVDVYEPATLTIEFDAGDRPREPADPPGVQRGEAVRGLTDETRLIAYAPDAASIVEVRDERGLVVTAGVGSAEVTVPGWFRARPLPGPHLDSEPVEVREGEEVTVSLPPIDDPLVYEVIGEVDAGILSRRATALSIAALASTLRGGRTFGAAELLASRAFGDVVPELPLHVVLVDRRRERDSVDLRLTSFRDGNVETGTTLFGPIGATSLPAGWGLHLLELAGLGPVPYCVPTFVAFDQPSAIIVEAPSAGPPIVSHATGSTLRASHALALDAQLVDGGQRLVASGHLDYATMLLDRADVDFDPVSQSLRVVLGLQQGRAATVDSSFFAAGRVGLPDALLFQGLRAGSFGDEGSLADNIERALRAGLPVTGPAMEAMFDALVARGDDERIEPMSWLLDRTVPGQAITTIAAGADAVLARAGALARS